MKVKDAVKKTKAKVKEAEGPVDAALKWLQELGYTAPILFAIVVGLAVLYIMK